LHKVLLYPTVYGAYTELYAGLSADLTINADQGVYIVPWGRRAGVKKDVAVEVGKEGGNAQRLYEWCDRVTREYT
jgi:hypothetical protein